ncbi:MAG: N-acetyl-gamma-glutamyl-phosphate reductase [Elusimicrobia bacterium CG06_land_8_20_14_3_00_38_11]|nr:MAG: N-acetyl-gamma-glutamyl-phosphate reductase [Elusimicrobia bacterium CG06_land_8_20_14_3_00_38_11]
MINVAVIGAKGYAGEELIKILLRHSGVKIISLSGRMDGKPKHISEMYSYLKGKLDIFCEDIDQKKIAENADIIFTALPHSVSMGIVSKFVLLNKKVIDLSADFRLKDAAVYEKWYGVKHTNPELLEKSVYGLCELYRKKIKKAKLLANPGCYPTSIILGCYPALKEKIIKKKGIIIDSKSGYSGGGREFVKNYKEPNCYAYQVGGIHRHIPEIEQELKCQIIFTPHVIPQERGMLSTIYLKLKKEISLADVIAVYKKYYENEPFIRIVETAMTKNVVNTNYCDIAINIDGRTNNLIITSAIDNLVKGAAGQAVQNMNIMFGIDEKEGLI